MTEQELKDVKAIVRELLKYEEIPDILADSDEEEDCEYKFDSGAALDKLTAFANS